MKRIFLIASVFLGLMFIFAIMTFPYERLAGPLTSALENGLQQSLGEKLDCQFDDLDFGLFSGLQTQKLECIDRQGSARIKLVDLQILALPFYQSLTTGFDKNSTGRLAFTSHALFSTPSQLSLEFESIALKNLLPFILAGVPPGQRFFIQDLDVAGLATGRADIPLKSLHNSNATVDLRIESLAIPSQSLLDTLNLKPINFEKARFLVDMKRGSINFQEVEVLSEDISAKVQGSFKVDEPLDQSQGQILLKWKIGTRSSLRNSSIAAQLVNGPCPQPDAEGFCTREFNNLEMLEDLISF